MSRTGPSVARQRRPVLASLAGLIAVSAYAGAVGLAIGVIDMGTDIEARFPFGSAVFAGVALALVVAGTLLVGWILVQLVMIQTFSWLQPIMAAAGASVLLGGLWPRLRSPAR